MKKIAFFTGQLMHPFQCQASDALNTAAHHLGYHIDTFSNFGAYGDNYLHAEGETNLIVLPRLENYDGIILAPDTFEIEGMYEKLVALIRLHATCPVVNLRYEDDRFYNILVDDFSAVRDMVSHFVEVHHFHRICFMTGRMEMKDAQNRLKGYLSAMEAYKLPVTDHMIFYGDYWKKRGEEAVDWFLSGELPPQAIVCSNDYMALSVQTALHGRGISVPGDICVSGFDNLEEGRFVQPPLATVDLPGDSMAAEALNVIDRLIRGETAKHNTLVPLTHFFRGTCGCPYHSAGHDIQALYEKKNRMQESIMQITYMNVDFESCDSVEELFRTAYKYSYNFSYDDIFICLCRHDENDSELLTSSEHFSEEMQLRVVFSAKNGIQFFQEDFARKDLLPQRYLQEEKPLILFSLHYKNHCQGYLVLRTEPPVELHEFFTAWVLGLSSYLEQVSVYGEDNRLKELRRQLRVDELTGLYNRREMEKILRRLNQEARDTGTDFCIMTIDMDGLKFINDSYGHLEGDRAICALAAALKNMIRPGIHCARVGGDEFTLCLEAPQENSIPALIESINASLEQQNTLLNAPYHVSASIGYACFRQEKSLMNCMQRADENMYHEKARKKTSRRYSPEVL